MKEKLLKASSITWHRLKIIKPDTRRQHHHSYPRKHCELTWVYHILVHFLIFIFLLIKTRETPLFFFRPSCARVRVWHEVCGNCNSVDTVAKNSHQSSSSDKSSSSPRSSKSMSSNASASTATASAAAPPLSASGGASASSDLISFASLKNICFPVIFP